MPPTTLLPARTGRLASALAAVACVVPSLAAADLALHSGPRQVVLLELYSSEGCSSCPPAERWLGTRRDDTGLWETYVPVAFHVNYWDRLGWPDRFATKAGTQRQYDYASAWSAGQVYTPEFVWGGREWRRDATPPAPAKDAGELVANWDAYAHTVTVTYTPPSGTRDTLIAHAALLGGGLSTSVKRGENAGRELTHEFVVVAWNHATLASSADGVASMTATITLPEVDAGSRPALAVWVSRRDEPAPLQATGGWLPAPSAQPRS